MNLPLENRLKKRAHVQIALLQDELADLVYSVEEKAVLHGGTAIWRCYGGNRFSEDLDFYAPASALEQLPEKAKERGIDVLKFKRADNLIFAKFSDEEAEVRLEVNHANASAGNGVVTAFEKTDGSSMQVLTLTPEQLISEKIAAYQSRRLIRDLYDIHHLGGMVKDGKEISKKVAVFLANLPQPVDEGNLKAIVYSGAIPSFEQLKQSLERRWA